MPVMIKEKKEVCLSVTQFHPHCPCRHKSSRSLNSQPAACPISSLLTNYFLYFDVSWLLKGQTFVILICCFSFSQRWNAHETSSEEYEAEGASESQHSPSEVHSFADVWRWNESPSLTSCLGQMHLWNPDEPSTPRKSSIPLPSCLEERLREACAELKISWDGYAGHAELLALCEHLSLEVRFKTRTSFYCISMQNTSSQ